MCETNKGEHRMPFHREDYYRVTPLMSFGQHGRYCFAGYRHNETSDLVWVVGDMEASTGRDADMWPIAEVSAEKALAGFPR